MGAPEPPSPELSLVSGVRLKGVLGLATYITRGPLGLRLDDDRVAHPLRAAARRRGGARAGRKAGRCRGGRLRGGRPDRVHDRELWEHGNTRPSTQGDGRKAETRTTAMPTKPQRIGSAIR